MNRSTKICCLVIALITTQITVAQDKRVEKADVLMSQYAYMDAISLYEAALDKGYDSTDVYRKLAHCYDKLNYSTQAEKWYERLVSNEDHEPNDEWEYAQVLKKNEKYFESGYWVAKYYEKAKNDPRAATYMNAGDYFDIFQHDSGKVIIEHPKFNSSNSDFAPSIFDEQLIFTSARPRSAVVSRKSAFNYDQFLDLYSIPLKKINRPEFIEYLSNKINSRLHDANASFTTEGEMYFSRNIESVDKGKTLRLKILRANLENGKWKVIDDFPFNHDDYSVGHPFITKDGNTLYFASDMPGSYGGTDIFKCEKNGSGQWSDPVNLGPMVNTQGQEQFPYFDKGVLYFASDGHLSIGGLDIFASPLIRGEHSSPQNLGFPLNSASDDFGLVVETYRQKGFFSSNRKGGSGSDDIYEYTLKDSISYFVTGVAVDSETQQATAGSEAILLDLENNILEMMIVGDDGVFFFDVTKYNKEGYKILIKNDENGYESEATHVFKNNGINNTTALGAIKLTRVPVVLSGSVYDLKDHSVLSDVSAIVTDPASGTVITEMMTDDSGEIVFELERGTTYEITLSKSGYFNKTFMFNPSDYPGKTVSLADVVETFLEEIVLNESRILDTYGSIYYDLGDWTLRPEATEALDYLSALLEANPTVTVEISSHTDSRGSEKFNEELSEKRARSAYNYIVNIGGINASRLVFKGYGESRIINECTDGIRCEEEDHQKNRRTEFKVLSF